MRRDSRQTPDESGAQKLLLDRGDELVAAIGRDDFLAVFAGAIARILKFEFLVIFLYRQDAAPARLHDSIKYARHRKGLQNYLQNTYVLNPFYQAVRNGLEPGVYFMKSFSESGSGPDLTCEALCCEGFRLRPDRFEEIGYLTDDWPSGMQELLLALPVDPVTMIEVSLSKKEADGGFSQQDVEDANAAFPLLHALMRKHWEFACHRLAPESEAPLLDRLFMSFGEELLSERERQVIRLVLLGHTSTSVALNLDVALPTVKSHRRNAYAKLGISSQAELFALFMESVAQVRGALSLPGD